MPLKPHPTDPDKMVYVKGEYTKLIPMQPNLPEATTALDTVVKPKRWVECAKCKKLSPLEEREWVGLTDAEIMASLPSALRAPPLKMPPGWRQFADALDAILKEKNT